MIHSFCVKHKKWSALVCVLIPLILSLGVTFGLGYRVLINTTHSLPQTLYLTNPSHAPFARGDLVTFTHPASSMIIVKRVMGVEGDLLTPCKNAVSVNKHTLALKTKRSNGTPLTPIKAHTVPKGMVFVAGEHVDSFDSRYEEFGLVPLSQVMGRVWPLF